MKRYLSFGGGVNSTALGLWLIDQGIDTEWVYADHGADWPETREYVAMLQDKGYPITVLDTRRQGLDLYTYYFAHKMIPQRMIRACTVEYKLVPLASYMSVPCEVYIGISADEAHRVSRLIEGQRQGEIKLFSLVDEGIDRKGCIEIIEAHGLPAPIKSGCFICPFQRRSQWVRLRTAHPELYCKAKRLEDREIEAMRAKGRLPFYLADKPLDAICEADQADMWGERDMSPCLCEV